MRTSSVNSVKSILDQNYRIKQLKLIENTLKEHFKYGILDVGNMQKKPLLASRALNSNQLRQHAFEQKVESYLKETNQIMKLIEFQRAKHLAATMFEIASGHASSIDHSVNEPVSNPGERVKTIRKSESSFNEHQKQIKRYSKDVQRKNEILLQQQVMLSLSPRIASDSDITKLQPTLINLPDDSEIIQQLEGLVDLQNIRRVSGAIQHSSKAKTVGAKSSLDNAIKAKKIKLSSKPPKSKNKATDEPNNYLHDQTIPEEEQVVLKKPINRVQSAYTRHKASKQQLASTFISSTQNLQSAINSSLGQLSPKIVQNHNSTKNKDQLQVKMIASKETDMQLIKIGQSTDGSDIMKYTAWNNQQRNMPLKIQFQVESITKPRRVQSANQNRFKRLTAVQPLMVEQVVQIDSIYMQPEQKVPTNELPSLTNNHLAITDQISKSANQRANFQAPTHGSDNLNSESQQIVDFRYSKHSFYHPNIRQSGDQKRVIMEQPQTNLMFDVIEEKSPKHQSMDQTKVENNLLDDVINDGELKEDQAVSPKNAQRLRASGAKSSLLFYEQQINDNISKLREHEKRKSIFSRQQNHKVEESAGKQSSNRIVSDVSTPVKVQTPQVEKQIVVRQRPKTVTTRQPPAKIVASQLQLHPVNKQMPSQAELLQKPKSQVRYSGKRKTFGQRIGELVSNFDKKFVLTNQQIPEAIKSDLQATRIKPQSAIPRQARGVRPLTGKVRVPVRSIEKSQPLLLESALFDSAQALKSRMNSFIKKKNSTCTENMTFDGTKAHSPNRDIENVIQPPLQVSSSQTPIITDLIPEKMQSAAKLVQLQLMLNQQTEDIVRSISPKTKSKKPTISQGETLSSRKTAYSPSKQTIQTIKPLEFLQGTAILINKDQEIADGVKARTRPGFIVNKEQKMRQPSAKDRQMAQNVQSNKHKYDLAYAYDQENQTQAFKAAEKQVDEYSFNQSKTQLKDLTLTSPTLNSKTDLSVKQSIRNININDPIYSKQQGKEKSIEESFFIEDMAKIAQKQVKSKVRIQSGKTVAQQKLIQSRIQHENVPPAIIVSQSNARRHDDFTTRQIAPLQRFKGNPQFNNSQARLDFTYGDLESFFQNIAKSTKSNTNANSISKNAFLRGKGYFLDSGTTNSHLKVQRNLNAKNQGICSKGRPFKSQINSVKISQITSPANIGLQIKSRSPVGIIKSSRYHNQSPHDKNANTLQTIGQASALSRNPRLSPVPHN